MVVLLAAAAWAQVEAPPVLVYHTQPQYSVEAQQKKVEGSVKLYAQIGTDGRAHRLRVIQSLGSGLDENAVAAVRQWRFRPALKNGRPVATESTIEVDFHLYNTGKPKTGVRV